MVSTQISHPVPTATLYCPSCDSAECVSLLDRSHILIISCPSCGYFDHADRVDLPCNTTFALSNVA
jgi:Zn ribbon nucleic-acid-binding protein